MQVRERHVVFLMDRQMVSFYARDRQHRIVRGAATPIGHCAHIELVLRFLCFKR